MSKPKYAPLSEYLLRLPTSQQKVTLTFAEIEEIIGGKLPKSASTHQAWWANERNPTQVQKVAWGAAGWRVSVVDIDGSAVEFARVGREAGTSGTAAVDPFNLLLKARAASRDFLLRSVCRYSDSLDDDLLAAISSELKMQWGSLLVDLAPEMQSTTALIRELDDLPTAGVLHTTDHIKDQLPVMLRAFFGREVANEGEMKTRLAVQLSWSVTALFQMQTKFISLLEDIPNAPLQLRQLTRTGSQVVATAHDPDIFRQILDLWGTVQNLLIDYFGRKALVLNYLGRANDWRAEVSDGMDTDQCLLRAWGAISSSDPTLPYHLYTAYMSAARSLLLKAAPKAAILFFMGLTPLVSVLRQAGASPVQSQTALDVATLLGDGASAGLQMRPSDQYCLLRYVEEMVDVLERYELDGVEEAAIVQLLERSDEHSG
ncbi:MAG: DUF7662 domain-containing protein [Armatimonadota bacterium]